MHIHSMQELKSKALVITKETRFFDPLTGKSYALRPDGFSRAYRKRYAYKDGIFSFIDEENVWYSIPCFEGINELLKEQEYVKTEFFVPCSDGAYPIQEKDRWCAMLEEMRTSSF